MLDRMRTAVAFCLLLILALPARGDDLAPLRSRDPEARLAAVKRLSGVAGEEVSKALARSVGDPDPRVREAALDALGERGDETCVRALRRALRSFKKDPETLPVVVTALGEAGDADSAEAVVKLARQALGTDPRLAEAAIDALGSLRHTEAVGGLIELLGTASPVRGGASSRTGHARYVPGILQSLREVTGLPFRQRETWPAWWRHARRDWRPSPLDVAEVEGFERRDDGWRFRIERPNPARWEFAAVKGAALRIRWAGPRSEAVVAWIDVAVHAGSERAPKDLAAAVREAAETLRATLPERDEERLGQAAKLGGETARLHEAAGRLADGRGLRSRVWILERHGLVYVVSAHVATGASERVEAEVEGILGSFRLLDR
jgi:hypothetical protein